MIVVLSDRRYWPSAQDCWQDGFAAVAPEHVVGAVAEEWSASIGRLGVRLDVGVVVSVRSDGRMVAVANGGYPLRLRTVEEHRAWDEIAAAHAAD